MKNNNKRLNEKLYLGNRNLSIDTRNNTCIYIFIHKQHTKQNKRTIQKNIIKLFKSIPTNILLYCYHSNNFLSRNFIGR